MADSLGPRLIAVISFMLALSWIFVLLRCYVRLVLVKSAGSDDYLCVLAQFLFTIYAVLSAAAVPNGLGEHIENVDLTTLPATLKNLYISDPFYIFANMALKISSGIFLLRICITKGQRAIIWVVMASSAIMCIFAGLITIFQCQPVSYFWEQGSGATGTCLPSHVLIASTYAYTAWSCWSDWTYFFLPCFVVWHLQMDRRTKIGVCVILGVTSVASILTIVRIPSISGLNGGHDFLYTVAELKLWSICETGLALAACSSATLRPLIRQISGKLTTNVSSDISMRGRTKGTKDSWPSHARYTRTVGTVDKDGLGVQTIAEAHAGSSKGTNPSRWPEDDRSSILDADEVSNSSQTKLKTDLENGITAKDYASGIKKTVTVTTHSLKIQPENGKTTH